MNDTDTLTPSILRESVMQLSEKLVALAKAQFEDNLLTVCLFGSAVRDCLKKGSDIDYLLIVKNADAKYQKRIKDIIRLSDNVRETEEYEGIEKYNLNLEPSFLLHTKKEIEHHPTLLLDISQEGIHLYDADGFLESHLAQIRESMQKLGSVRKVTPHGHYWVLKPDIKHGEVIIL